MKIKGFVWACALAGMLLPGSKAIAQANMKNGFLNVQMREALCGQNWPRAIQVLDTMKRISPKDRSSLERYRSFLVNFRNNNTRIAAWPASDYCAGTVEALPNPNATNPNSGSGSNPNMRTDTVPTF
ncbi:hypothetical protein [Synechococcus sp. BDU 130192]|uniref:hypothetical protein n=1 Tax=Synechococcus sp. BDU 130192 TaxID=2042059 RepID=UPI000C072C18|nr:hypothetical protein [Synechococcus sp. BDU 130192]